MKNKIPLMKSMAAGILCGGLFISVPDAQAVNFRLPLAQNTSVHYYVDHAGAGVIRDWKCQGESYDGHKGTDFPTARYTPIYAGATGTLASKQDGWPDGSLGTDPNHANYVILNHAGGMQSWYWHMQINTVTTKPVGSTIACSEQIGQVGTSGKSSGPHLHFELRVNGSHDDPYSGTCGGPTSYWVNQNNGNPITGCEYNWNNWHVPVSGYSASAPALVATKAGTRAMFIQGGGNTLYHSVWTGSWSGWMALGGLSVNSSASACNRSGGMLDVVVRGTDNNIYMRNWNGSAWGGWYIPVPGYAASAPTIVDRQDGKLSIFITGGSGIIYEAYWNGSAWNGWISHAANQPAIASGAGPTACSRSVGTMNLVVRGNDGNIWMKYFNGTSWGSWSIPVSGYAASDPALVATGNGAMSMVIAGGGGLIYQAQWSGTAWSGYTSINGGLGFANTRPAACSLSPGKLDVAVRGGVNAYTTSDNIWMCNFQ